MGGHAAYSHSAYCIRENDLLEIHEPCLLPLDAASIRFTPSGHDRRKTPRHGDLHDMAPALQHRATDELGEAGGFQQLSVPLVHASGHRVDAR